MQSPIPNPQINPQSSIRHNPTESYKIQQKFVRARVPYYPRTHAHARNSPRNAATVRRVHPCGTCPTPSIPHSKTTPFPLQTTPFPLPFRHSRPRLRHSRTLPRHSRAPLSSSPHPPTSFPRSPFVIPAPSHVIPALPFRHSREGGNLTRSGGDAYSLAIHANGSNGTRAGRKLTRFPPSRE